MTANEIITAYLELRKTASVADAASETLSRASITPSMLLDTFSAAQLDLSRSDEEAAVLHKSRNELLAHFA